MTDQPTPQAGGDPAASADETFEAHDARLNKEMSGFDRARAGSKGAEFPHDENYKPGYHEGGTRFGFFNGDADAKPPAAKPPTRDDKADGKA